ncbi:hypothetical protein [Sutcliffiella rhizosphaerae]|uniref:Uncharacterized protein n=1 Tax=Sutcliffiella rhizosphaerae TaxID=2880967 RepID=A0ABM8YS49_9BACI|nr:hypothetical protein [Sutcliffiella rhizosphaerae]CAG9622824.1 hypothetical protein BACCIP111883_03615 [Sutcliffiella rhizosphaerae]
MLVKKANLNVIFQDGYILTPTLNDKEALEAILLGLKNGDAKEVKFQVIFEGDLDN